MVNPKVTVIVPCYNHAHFLPDAIHSILGQTFVDWEAIIVDDGSTDNTQEVAAQFTDPRIRYIYQENRGLSAARNTGLRNARGEFIALLDADDMWEPEFLEISVRMLETNRNIAATYCGFRYMDSNGNMLPISVCRVVPPDRFRDELLKGSWLSSCSVVVRASVYQEVGLFDESLSACEDYDMWLRISAKHQFVGIPEVLLRYRRVGNNMSDDVDRMSNALATVLEKHLGSLDTPIEGWSAQKLWAMGNLYTLRTFGYLAQGRVKPSAESMLHLLEVRPDFAQSLDAWYSLACVHQLVGQRGDPATWRPSQAESDLLGLLAELHTYNMDGTLLRVLHSQAYNALARMHYAAGNYQQARSSLLRSLLLQWRLSASGNRIALALRLLPGSSHLRRYRPKQQKSAETN